MKSRDSTHLETINDGGADYRVEPFVVLLVRVGVTLLPFSLLLIENVSHNEVDDR